MIKNYFYTTNLRIEEYLIRINLYRDLFEKIPQLPQIQENLLRKSTLQSSLFSARIEGNSLELRDVEMNHTQGKEKKEIFQIFSALKHVRNLGNFLTREEVCELHSIAMDGLGSSIGRFRTEQSAIFNTAGVAIYMPPSPQRIDALFEEFLQYMNASENELTRVAVAHFAFEKIHPFLDGNGRIGRILMNWHLKHLGYGFSGLISFEKHLENNRERYYEGLSIKGYDITQFVELICEAIAVSSENVVLKLQEKDEEKIEDTLLPRRGEILLLIREHTMMSFNQLQRRFLTVSSRTLHYDLEHLVKKKLVRKLGSTKGTVYVPF